MEQKEENKQIIEMEHEKIKVEKEEIKQVVEENVNLKDLYHENKINEFRSSPIISPVYGIQPETKKVKPEKSERDIEEELQRTTDFLNTLKDLQKNLE